MMTINLHGTTRERAIEHLNRHYPGCTLIVRDYGWDMFVTNHGPLGSHTVVAEVYFHAVPDPAPAPTPKYSAADRIFKWLL